MFSGISWSDYFIGLVIVLTCYYFLIAVCCYRREFAGLLRGKKNNPLKPSKAGVKDTVE